MAKTILTSFQQKVLEQVKLDPYLTSQFYFTGGTALSEYYFQHRLSDDLDFFSETDFNHNQLLVWLKKLQSHISISKLEQQNGNVFSLPHAK